MGRTFRLTDRYNLDLRVDSTNLLNHVTYTTWNSTDYQPAIRIADSGQCNAQHADHAAPEVLKHAMAGCSLSSLRNADCRCSADRTECSAREQPGTHNLRQHPVGGRDGCVKDKNGNPIEGLTAKDFTVTENGVPQTIRFCEHQEFLKTPGQFSRDSVRA